MPTVSGRRPIVARLVLCACAIVGACGQSHQDDASPSASASSSPASASGDASSQALQSNELQDWARQATSGDASPTPSQHAATAPVSSDALAPPVIHTVD